MTEIKINRVPIFVNEIFHFTLPNFDMWQKRIKQIVLVEENSSLNTTPDNECNIKASRTAWNSHERYPAMGELAFELDKYLKMFIKNEGYDVPRLEIQTSWINWYKKNQHATPHKHGDSLAVILFVDVEDTDAQLCFHADNNAVFIKKEDSNSNFSNFKTLDAKNGTVLFFDGSISHSVSANNTNKNRISAAFNYIPRYDKKRNEY
tara:strand:+ start:1907 stop:2524 length:618 start_codon:yes stop_codon:yes gene_type:complete